MSEVHPQVYADLERLAPLCKTAVHTLKVERVVVGIGEVLAPKGDTHASGQLHGEAGTEQRIEGLTGEVVLSGR